MMECVSNCIHCQHIFNGNNLKVERRRKVGKHSDVDLVEVISNCYQLDEDLPTAHTHKNTTLRLVPCDREQLTHFCHWLPSSPQKAERIGDGKGLNYSSYLYRGPSIDAPYQVSVHLAEGFQRRRLKCEK